MNKVEKLEELLSDSIKRSCEEEVGIVFSGGIDSVIIAILASKYANVKAYSCGIEGAPDPKYAEECRGLGFDLEIIRLTDEMVDSALKEIVRITGDRNPVKAAVEVPFYYASKHAREDGFSVMLCGQGADELFGGYNKYVEALKDGYSQVEEMMKYDIEHMYEAQLDKDIAVCKSNGVELRAPYMDKDFIAYVTSLPIEDKIRESGGYSCLDEVNGSCFIRKYILRVFGEKIGVPEPILHRKKKAAQYGSGSQRVLERLAKKAGYKKKAKDLGRTDYVKMYVEEL